MKTYALESLHSRADAEVALRSALPGQHSPSLLKDAQGDVIAYYNVVDSETSTDMFSITADVSGRHYTKDDEVVAVLQEISAKIGGIIINDDGIPHVPLQKLAR